MTARLLSITAWLAAGHALLLALFWLLLQVPESSAAMLTLSLLVALATIASAGWVEAVALGMWAPGAGWRQAVRRAAAAPLAAALGLLAFGLIWAIVSRASGAWTGHRGEIDAWLMLHFRWTRTAGLHRAAGWLFDFLRFAVGPLVALTMLGWATARGWRSLLRVPRWLAAALAPRRLVLATLLLYGLVWLPWTATYWRPRWLAPNWQEAAFVAVKLAVLYLVANAAWATLLYLVEEGARENGKLKTEN